MNLKKTFAVRDHSTGTSVALLLLRVVAGVAFMLHGWGKIQKPFSWMGPDANVPAMFQALAALSEFGGGLAWVLGLLTPLAALGIGCTMSVALYMHAVMRGDPFVSQSGGPSYEPAALYFSLAVLLLLAGPGWFSADRQIFGNKP